MLGLHNSQQVVGIASSKVASSQRHNNKYSHSNQHKIMKVMPLPLLQRLVFLVLVFLTTWACSVDAAFVSEESSASLAARSSLQRHRQPFQQKIITMRAPCQQHPFVTVTGRFSPSHTTTRTHTTRLSAKKSSDEETEKSPAAKLNTATLLLLPFVFLLGVDLLLNIAVLTKRSLEYFLLGQAPSSEPWW